MQCGRKTVGVLFEPKLGLPFYLTLDHLNLLCQLSLVPLIHFTAAYGDREILMSTPLSKVLRNTKPLILNVCRILLGTEKHFCVFFSFIGEMCNVT